MNLSPSQRDVLAALADGPKGRRALQDLTGRDERTVRRALGSLADLVAKQGDEARRMYEITHGGRDALAAHGSPSLAPGGSPSPSALPRLARGVSSQHQVSKSSNEEKSSGSASQATHGRRPGGAHPQEALDALESMTAYAKRLERQVVALLEEVATLKGRVSRDKTEPLAPAGKSALLRAVEPSSDAAQVVQAALPAPTPSAPSPTGTSSPRTSSPEEIRLAALEELHKHKSLVKAGNPKAKPIEHEDRWLVPKIAELERDPARVKKRLDERDARLRAEEAKASAPRPAPVAPVADPYEEAMKRMRANRHAAGGSS